MLHLMRPSPATCGIYQSVSYIAAERLKGLRIYPSREGLFSSSPLTCEILGKLSGGWCIFLDVVRPLRAHLQAENALWSRGASFVHIRGSLDLTNSKLPHNPKMTLHSTIVIQAGVVMHNLAASWGIRIIGYPHERNH